VILRSGFDHLILLVF